MPTVKMRERGQLTIPSEYRKELGIEKEDLLNIVKIGEVLVLTPKQFTGDKIAKKIEGAMRKKGLKLQDLLSNLRTQRKRYAQEVYGKSRTKNLS